MVDDEKTRSWGRILALDVGKKRIGLAVSDILRVTAQGLETLERGRIRDDLAKLNDLIQEREITLLLVGNPLHMSGSESRQSEYTREFADRLKNYAQVPLLYWDERLTSSEAERMLKQAGASLARRKKAVDRLAAVLLLESYLGYLEIQSTSTAEGESFG
ncbi:MAG TPA: Holliday junction resolvase RuvX [Bryobacteraceae bacterium]|nr:Holliday junction resolvase RuvX [Bryobacteraceae bacterium]